jgi:hypothetical protein
MNLDRYDTTIAFLDAPQKRSAHETLEICDINPVTGLSADGIPHLLERMIA